MAHPKTPSYLRNPGIEPPHLPLKSRGSLVRFQLRPAARKTRSRYLLGSIQRDLKIAGPSFGRRCGRGHGTSQQRLAPGGRYVERKCPWLLSRLLGARDAIRPTATPGRRQSRNAPIVCFQKPPAERNECHHSLRVEFAESSGEVIDWRLVLQTVSCSAKDVTRTVGRRGSGRGGTGCFAVLGAQGVGQPFEVRHGHGERGVATSAER